MAFILVRATNKKKALNSLADIERHAKLTIVGKPKSINTKKAHDVTKAILKKEPRGDVKQAVVVKVKESTTQSIMNLRKIHPPAHLIVISEEYPEYSDIKKEYNKSRIFDGYYSSKRKSSKSDDESKDEDKN